MKKNFLFQQVIAGLILVFLGVFNQSWGAEKLKLGTSIKLSTEYYLPILAAEEKGFWKQNGLEIEWVPFQSGADQVRALAAGSVSLGFSPSTASVMAAARGVPSVIAAELVSRPNWCIYILSKSPMKQPRDLRGTKIGVPRLGGTSHAYGAAVVRALGIEKDVRFVGAGGIAESMAALKTGAIDAMVEPPDVMASLVLKGEIRSLISVRDYVPSEWLEHVLFVHKDFLAANTDVVKRIIKATFLAIDFVQQNPKWVVEKIKETSGFSDEEAELARKELAYAKTGKVNPQAVENVRNFLVEYGLVAKDKAPPVDQLYVIVF